MQDRAPRVRFALAQSGASIVDGAHELFPIPVEPPTWWERVAETQPLDGALGERLWAREQYTIVARPANGPSARVAFALRDAGGTEWRLGFVPSPVLRVMWLDDTTVVAGTREALTRAFNDAALYSEDTRVVSHPRRRPPSAVQLRLASYARPAAITPRRHPPSQSRR